MVTKYKVNPDSNEYKHGYACFMTGRHMYYYPRTEYQKYKDQKVGYEVAKEDSKIFATKAEAFKMCRMSVMQSAIGKSEEEARNILRLPDGNVYRHEIDAVIPKLSSTSEAFNEGRDAYLKGRTNKDCPYSIMIDYANHINWQSGFESTELAVKLHGRKTVIETL